MESTFDKGRQMMQENRIEREGRKTGDFGSIEKALPKHISSRMNVSIVDSLTSYMGSRNPMSKSVDPKTESVWLFDSTAYRPVHIYPHKEQPFQAEFIAAYFRRGTGKDISKFVANIADTIGLTKDERPDAEKVIAKRLQPIVDTIAPARSISVKFPGGAIHKLGPGGRSGVSQDMIVDIAGHKDGDVVDIPAVVPEATPYGPMRTNFAGPEGWLVLSDIDDTIKVTMTPSPVGILKSTFVSTPAPIVGMPAFYANLHQTLNPTWFYLSASPYNLYPFLRSFLHSQYPPGPIILREASWMDLGGFLASLTQGTEAYKRSRIEKLHHWFPKRKVLCIGDSTQSDPEAYGDIARTFKGWVKAIFIRKVTDVAEMQSTDKNSDERFEKAFKGVPREIWRTFDDPKELEREAERLKGL